MQGQPDSPSSSGSPISASLAALEKAKERQEEARRRHYAWKRELFVARAPPPPIGRLHRCNRRSERKYTGTHAQFSIAKSLLKYDYHHIPPAANPQCHSGENTLEGNLNSISTTLPEGSSSSATLPALPEGEVAEVFQQVALPLSPVLSFEKREGIELPVPSASASSSTNSSSREEAWRLQMQAERHRRQPYTDLSIRTDPKRTILIANLPPDAVEDDVRVFLERFGRVTYTRVIRDWGKVESQKRKTEKRRFKKEKHHARPTATNMPSEDEEEVEEGKEVYTPPRSRRYGFAEFGLVAEANKAIRHTRQFRLKGYTIVMDRERGRELDFLPKRLAMALAFEEQKKREEEEQQRREGMQARKVKDGASTTATGRKRMLHDGTKEGREEDGEHQKRKRGETWNTGEKERCDMDEEMKKPFVESPATAACSSLALLSLDAEGDNDDDFLNAILSHQDD